MIKTTKSTNVQILFRTYRIIVQKQYYTLYRPPQLLLTLMITDEQIATTVHRHHGSTHAATVSRER